MLVEQRPQAAISVIRLRGGWPRQTAKVLGKALNPLGLLFQRGALSLSVGAKPQYNWTQALTLGRVSASHSAPSVSQRSGLSRAISVQALEHLQEQSEAVARKAAEEQAQVGLAFCFHGSWHGRSWYYMYP